MAVDRKAAISPSQTLNWNASTKLALLKNASYQRSENPLGGNVLAVVGLKELKTMIRIGASRKT